VNGTIVKASVQDGSYYAEALSEGFDPAGPNESQGYITAVATRALIFIEAKNPDIGPMCVMPVGMAEVSSCDITEIKKKLKTSGKVKIKKGDPLGTFRFVGSTHCLFFRPEVRPAIDLHGQTPGLSSGNIPVKARLATVCK
jgi:phosphatidylserine decarboxylase